MKTFSSLLLSLLAILFSFRPATVVDKEQAKKAFLLLNEVRANPEKYAKEFELDLNEKNNHTPLVWNDTLAKVAEAKAFDMAERNYFGHVDPDGYGINYYMGKAGYKMHPIHLQSKSENNFESICAGATSGEDAIRILIIDSGTPGLGHRVHLMGMSWYNDLVDIGIGYAHNPGSTYGTYVSVVIAKHDQKR